MPVHLAPRLETLTELLRWLCAARAERLLPDLEPDLAALEARVKLELERGPQARP